MINSIKTFLFFRTVFKKLVFLEIILKFKKFSFLLKPNISFGEGFLENEITSNRINFILEENRKLQRVMKSNENIKLFNGRDSHGIFKMLRDYLFSTMFDFKFTSFIQHLKRYNANTRINIEELEMTFNIIKCICLLEIYKILVNKILQGSETTDIEIIRLLATLHSINGHSSLELVEMFYPHEEVLNSDPANVYAVMDENSKSFYRKNLSIHAKLRKVKESELMDDILSKCRENPGDILKSHIGYYLVGDGKHETIGAFPKEFNVSCFFKMALNIFFKIYCFIVIFLSLVLAAIFLHVVLGKPYGASLLIIPYWILIMELIDFSIMKASGLFPKKTLLSLEQDQVLRQEIQVTIAIPCIIDSSERVHKIFENMKLNAITINNKNVNFVLLSDWEDSSDSNNTEQELELLEMCFSKLEELNRILGSTPRNGFMLLHRNRVYSPNQGVWYGWERKSGKIQQLLRLINSGDSTFEYGSDNIELLKNSEYLIVLDEDVLVTIDSVNKLISSMMHPLNIPQIDASSRSVLSGYGLAIPSFFTNPDHLNKWRLDKFFITRPIYNINSVEVILDSYRNSLFDIFSETAFTGKGIYDIGTASQHLIGLHPPEQILSHDIIEGAVLRTGYVPDAIFVENFPTSYKSYVIRMHRWIRGDWQNFISYFLLEKQSKSHRNFLTYLLFSNVRKSLVNASLLTLLIAAIFNNNSIKSILLASSLLFPLIPEYISISFKLFSNIVSGTFLIKIFESCLTFLRVTTKEAVKLYHRPHFFFVSLDAIILSFWRTFRRSKTLEWVSSGTHRNISYTIFSSPYIVSVAAAILLIFLYVYGLLNIAVLIATLAWLFFPIVVKWYDCP